MLLDRNDPYIYRHDAKIDAVAAMMDGLVAYKNNKDAFE